MKQFLYLIQSRQKFLDNHKILESKNSDYVVLTFEEKVDRKNFLYLPNSVWEEGRNALIEHARNLPQKYEYYVLLDDDISFIKGSFREFEREVLLSNPDFTTPVYWPKQYARLYYSLVSKYFKYSQFIQIDCCFVCFSQKLFFSDLLPYKDYFTKNPLYKASFFSTYFFWLQLFKYPKAKRIVVNSIVINNTYSDFLYTPINFFSMLKKIYLSDYKYTKYSVISLPVISVIEIIQDLILYVFGSIKVIEKIIRYGIGFFVRSSFILIIPIFLIKTIVLNKRIIQLTQRSKA